MWLMQFNLVHNKEMLIFLCLWVHDGAVCLAVSALRHTCTGSCRSNGLSIWNPVGKSVMQPSYFSASLPVYHSFLFFPLSTVITVWQVPQCPCIGAHGWVVGIACHGSVLLSRGWRIAMEAPGHPGQPHSAQLYTVVNYNKLLLPVFLSKSYDWECWYKERCQVDSCYTPDLQCGHNISTKQISSPRNFFLIEIILHFYLCRIPYLSI